MSKIKSLKAREILDSRGWPTIETEILLDNGLKVKASVPGGLAIGVHEAFELRDGDKKRYQGRGVLQAITKINEVIAPVLLGLDVLKQTEIDKKLIALDGTADKSHLGANSTLAVSLVCARAGAQSQKQELFVYLKTVYSLAAPKIPVPIFNIFNGATHADTNLDFQEFLIIPKKNTAAEMIRQGAEIFYALKEELNIAGYDTDTGSEGGYAPDLNSSIEAIEFMLAAAIRAGYNPGKDLWLGIDIGSTILFEETTKRYVFPLDKTYFTAENLVGLYDSWLRKYPIIYLEDPLAEDDWDNWRNLTSEIGEKLMISGDALFATNTDRLRRGIKEQAANSIVIEPNQVGTLTEAVDCVKLADKHNFKIIVSHRSGETNDDFIVDFAVALGADYLKAGSLSRGERVTKYNRLMEIADILENYGK
jgi:enolase